RPVLSHNGAVPPSTARRCCCPQPGTPPRDCRRASYRAGSGHVPIARGEGNGSEGFLRLCRKVAWKRNKKVAIKYGFEGARELSLAWQGLRVCASASPLGGQYHCSSPRVLHSYRLST